MKEAVHVWLSECGSPSTLHDVDPDDAVPGLQDWLDSGKFNLVKDEGNGMVLSGRRSWNALCIFARWYIENGHNAQVMSLMEFAVCLEQERREGVFAWSQGIKLLCLSGCQDEGPSPLSMTQIHDVAQFLRWRWRDGQATIFQVEKVNLSWWQPWFAEIMADNFVHCNTNAFVGAGN